MTAPWYWALFALITIVAVAVARRMLREIRWICRHERLSLAATLRAAEDDAWQSREREADLAIRLGIQRVKSDLETRQRADALVAATVGLTPRLRSVR